MVIAPTRKHDVTGEARDYRGRWTSDGVAAEPLDKKKYFTNGPAIRPDDNIKSPIPQPRPIPRAVKALAMQIFLARQMHWDIDAQGQAVHTERTISKKEATDYLETFSQCGGNPVVMRDLLDAATAFTDRENYQRVFGVSLEDDLTKLVNDMDVEIERLDKLNEEVRALRRSLHGKSPEQTP